MSQTAPIRASTAEVSSRPSAELPRRAASHLSVRGASRGGSDWPAGRAHEQSSRKLSGLNMSSRVHGRQRVGVGVPLLNTNRQVLPLARCRLGPLLLCQDSAPCSWTQCRLSRSCVSCFGLSSDVLALCYPCFEKGWQSVRGWPRTSMTSHAQLSARARSGRVHATSVHIGLQCYALKAVSTAVGPT